MNPDIVHISPYKLFFAGVLTVSFFVLPLAVMADSGVDDAGEGTGSIPVSNPTPDSTLGGIRDAQDEIIGDVDPERALVDPEEQPEPSEPTPLPEPIEPAEGAPTLSEAAPGRINFGVRIPNPLAVDSIPELLTALIAVIIVIAVPIVVFFIILAGYLYITANGNSEKIMKAHRALLFAIVGGLIILGAQAIAQIIGNLIDVL